jgi:hypothetical protein
MENIPKPDEVEDMINQKIEGDEEEYGSRDRISRRSDLNMEY